MPNTMTPEQISTTLQRALKVDINALAERAGAQAHNLREEWNATTRKVSEFADKYIQTGGQS